MEYSEFYGADYEKLKLTENKLSELIDIYSAENRENEGVKSIVYSCSRIKSPESVLKKLENRGLDMTENTAIKELYDVVGIRAVCAFADDVYRLVDWLKNQPSIKIIKEKDYFFNPKPNGYRSYHILIEMTEGEICGCKAEIQVRTIAVDFWATLEHQLKYKKKLPDEKLIQSELKRCADEIASVDLSMQTIRDIIRESK